MNIIIGNDHAAIDLKKDIISHLADMDNINATDCGAQDKQSLDYPDCAQNVCNKILSGAFEKGILLCGTGAGMCITANKIKGIRAVVCSDPYTAKLARAHNDANVLCIGARVVGNALAKIIVDAFLAEPFEGGRHAARVAKIMEIESKRLN